MIILMTQHHTHNSIQSHPQLASMILCGYNEPVKESYWNGHVINSDDEESRMDHVEQDFWTILTDIRSLTIG